ncbi:MAG: aminoglycoside phosphotransferase [Pseudonocardiales bacterium]
MISRDQLQPLVQYWLPAQRWFAGKGRDPSVEVEQLAVLSDAEPDVSIWIAHVTYADGGSETYQLPLAQRDAPVGHLEHVLLGTLDSGDGPRWVYDALHDKDVTQAWLEGIHDASGHGALRFVRNVEAAAIPVGEQSLVSTAEQSNTSLMYGDAAILKVFRRLQPGINPDIEIHAALGELGAPHIARLLGSVSAELDGAPYALAMLQEYLSSATDGWELAKASVRDLMAEADLHAEEAGGDFAGEAERLGAAVAQTHADLAAAFGQSAAAADELAERVAGMHARLEAAMRVVPELTPLAEGLRATFDAVSTIDEPLTLQRIHGDLHLGQVLRTVRRWVVIDFEGEPMADLSARRDADSPLRDIAGMLRSFEYAGHYRIIETGTDAQLSYRADEWTQRNRNAFCDGYAAAAGYDPRAQTELLRAFESDKAVYEAVYEARNRPTWLPIPLASLARLAKEGAQ